MNFTSQSASVTGLSMRRDSNCPVDLGAAEVLIFAEALTYDGSAGAFDALAWPVK
jgi:hypothetical protein